MLRMWAGFELGTTITSLLRVKTTGFEQLPFLEEPLRKRHVRGGEDVRRRPLPICAASAFEPPKEYFSFLSIAGKTFVSEAAA